MLFRITEQPGRRLYFVGKSKRVRPAQSGKGRLVVGVGHPAGGGPEVGTGNQSVARAVLVLNSLAAARGDMELGVTELSEQTGLAKSVVSRILAPLVEGGYVERNPRTRRYRVGVRMFEVGLRYLRHSGVREAALVLLEQLARETGATSYLGVLDGTHCVVLAAIEGSDRLRVVVTAGERTPVHVTAMGKAILATLDDDTLAALLGLDDDGTQTEGWRLPPAEDHWRTLSGDELWEDLILTRERGYAVTQRDGYLGIWSVGCALPVQGEGAPMAVSVDLPAYGATEEQLHSLGQLLAARTGRFATTVLNNGQGTMKSIFL